MKMKRELEFIIMVPFLLAVYPIIALITTGALYYNSLKVVAREGISGLQERLEGFKDLVEVITEEMKND